MDDDRLKWQRSDLEGWFVAYPVPGDTRFEASMHLASGRTHGPQWLWKVRAGMGNDKLRNGACLTKQDASDAANAAWVELSAATALAPKRDS